MNEHDQALPLTQDLLVLASNNTRKWPALFRETLAHVPSINRGNEPFAVRLADIPEPHRTAFQIALRRIGRPTFDEGNFALFCDWKDWVDGHLAR